MVDVRGRLREKIEDSIFSLFVEKCKVCIFVR